MLLFVAYCFSIVQKKNYENLKYSGAKYTKYCRKPILAIGNQTMVTADSLFASLIRFPAGRSCTLLHRNSCNRKTVEQKETDTTKDAKYKMNRTWTQFCSAEKKKKKGKTLAIGFDGFPFWFCLDKQNIFFFPLLYFSAQFQPFFPPFFFIQIYKAQKSYLNIITKSNRMVSIALKIFQFNF